MSFKSTLQKLTAQSTQESEVIAMAYSSKEAVYFVNMLLQLGFEKQFNSASLFGDNTGALHVVGNPTCCARTKHIALRLFYLKELFRDGETALHHVPTQNQSADIIATKYLSRNTVEHLIGLIKGFAA